MHHGDVGQRRNERLALSGGGALYRGEGIARSLSLLVFISETGRARSRSHAPLDVAGEHAREGMAMHAIDELVVYRAYVEVSGLQAAKSALNAA